MTTPMLLLTGLIGLTGLTGLAGLTSLTPAGPTAPDPGIHQVSTAPVVDGAIAEWESIPIHPIVPRSEDPVHGDAAGRARFAYDDDFLYLALEVPDDTLVFRERGWRYGDGFYLTVLMPGAGEESASHISFGFSRGAAGLERVVVNRSGEYFPRISLDEVRFAMRPDPGSLPAPADEAVAFGGVVAYEVAVPWSLLAPAHPLLLDSLAVNVITVDADGGRARRFGMLAPDPSFDTERTPVRRGRMLPLVGGNAPDAPALVVRSPRPVIALDEPVVAGIGYRAPRTPAPSTPPSTPESAPARLHVELVQDGRVVAGMDTTTAGTRSERAQRILARLEPGSGARTGPATLRVRIEGRAERGEVRVRSLFLVDRLELRSLELELERIESDPEVTGAVRHAVPSAAVRLSWLRDFLESAPSNAALEGPLEWWREAEAAAAALRAGATGLPGSGGSYRLAHRSGIDGTLQPYSVRLPDDYDPHRPGGYPVLVALHGSGVDERGTLRSAGAAAAERGWIVVAPRGRGLSDWYVGDAETDVLETLSHAARILPLDTTRVGLAGFSMGGYGAWRLALRHGARFTAAAVLAGAACPPTATGGECVDALLREARAAAAPEPEARHPVPPLLVIHGARDQAVPVGDVRPLIPTAGTLTALEYREIPDAGHGHAAWWASAAEWLAAHF